MGILIGIFIALIAVVALATLLSNKFKRNSSKGKQEEQAAEVPSDCCGAHEVCEFEEMRQNPDEIFYFEDEELDRFRGIAAEQYTDSQIDEFREVLYTLKTDELPKWLVSIERRNVQLPLILRQEALLLLADV
ncbi:hypothetical protein [Mangrovibacterium marinum]|uniref:Phospholipase n=1 Tax=Mangrovibacterium marinum TaxID=1639118 RepID=A0A2T5BZ01_9BACT|nr:hypothetical protein [Mangrovibacterium marinum]PTN07485.1 hypothetical protein C8N47_1167 [Mangrovibacterium marinum]